MGHVERHSVGAPDDPVEKHEKIRTTILEIPIKGLAVFCRRPFCFINTRAQLISI